MAANGRIYDKAYQYFNHLYVQSESQMRRINRLCLIQTSYSTFTLTSFQLAEKSAIRTHEWQRADFSE
jgi:hypothetical protein